MHVMKKFKVCLNYVFFNYFSVKLKKLTLIPSFSKKILIYLILWSFSLLLNNRKRDNKMFYEIVIMFVHF